jgi:hypothetical protein
MSLKMLEIIALRSETDAIEAVMAATLRLWNGGAPTAG